MKKSTLCLFTLGLLIAGAAAAQSPVPNFSKSFNPSTIGPGSVSTLRFDITNNSSFGVRNLAFSDTLPAGVTIATPANATSSCAGIVSAPDGGATISLTGGEVNAGSSCSVRVDVTSSTPGTHTNVSGDLTSDAGNSGSATADLTVATDRPGFLKSFSPAAVSFGARTTLTLTIDNTANGAGAANLTFTDNLPAGMTVASPSNAATTCGGGTITAVPGSSVISYAPSVFGLDATVGAGASCTVTVDVTSAVAGTVGNTTGELTSTPTGSFTSRSSGKASAVLDVTLAQLALTKSFIDDPAVPGGTVTLQFQITNLDRRSPATDLAFTDDLDAVLSGLQAVGLPLTDPCGAGSEIAGTSILSFTGGNLGIEETCTFSVTLQVPAATAAGTYGNTTSQIEGLLDGTPVTAPAGAHQVVVAAVPVLTKTFIGDPVAAGGTVDLEFTITNTSTSSSATDISFQDTFVVELPSASTVPADPVCGGSLTYTPLISSGFTNNPALLTLTGGTLAPSASCSFTLSLDVALDAASGTYPNTTTPITATVDGATVVGGAASDSFSVISAPSLNKEFIDDPVAAGGTVTLRFTISNDGGAEGDASFAASAISFTDDLTATLSGLEAVGLPAADVCGTGSEISGTTNLSFTGGSLGANESCSFDVTLQVPAGAASGSYTNTTSNIVATVEGVATAGNAASDDLRVAGLLLTKEFLNDPALPGGTVDLQFTIQNVGTDPASAIFFRDDLDEVINGLAGTGLPLADPCGAGSSLVGLSGNTLLQFSGGVLDPGNSCSFTVTVQVPAGTESDTYPNRTSSFQASIGGNTVAFDNATDNLTVEAEFLTLDKEFIDDPAVPGGTVTLRFTLANLSDSLSITDIAFTDDLDAALSGLEATGTPFSACGGTVSGSSLLSLSGGTLAPLEVCSFDVTLNIPAGASIGAAVVNTTSEATGQANGTGVTAAAASDELQLTSLAFSKAFLDDPVDAGSTVFLEFTIQNLSTTDTASDLTFSDDLEAVIPGLEAIGLPVSDVCGTGSVLTGTSVIELVGGTLLPGGSCTFSVELQVPAGLPTQDYFNQTSELRQTGGVPAAPSATDTLSVTEVVDSDGDGVLDAFDECPGTVIPESVPTESLGVNRFALVDGDGIFDTTPPPGGGKGPRASFTIEDTAGCSCEQIIEAFELGEGHVRYGCSLGAMRDWLAYLAGFSGSASGGTGGGEVTTGATGITVVVSGAGIVTSSKIDPLSEESPSITCNGGESCQGDFPEGSTVVFYARPTGWDSEFVSWGGNCSGTSPVARVSAQPGLVCSATFRTRSE